MTDTQLFTSELDDPKATALAVNMAAAGQDPYEKVQADYFAIGDDVTTYLPDGVSWVTHKTLTEGDRRKYLGKVNRDMKLQKGTGDAIMRLAAGEDRAALLSVAITGWNLIRNGQSVKFDDRSRDQFLTSGPVAIVELIEKAVKANNPWLTQDMTVEDIDAEIASLQDLRAEVAEREAGNGGFAN
jgi:hypothetical protein